MKTKIIRISLIVISVGLLSILTIIVLNTFFSKKELPKIIPAKKNFTVCQCGECIETDKINTQSQILPGCLEIENGVVCGNFTLKVNSSSTK